MERPNYTPGQTIKIQCHNSATNTTDWLDGEFISFRSATDREYRIHCKLADGREIADAAPECVKPANLLDKFKDQAQRAHYWTSFDPEKRGANLINEFNQQLTADIEELENASINAETIAGYVTRYEKFFTAWLSAKSRCISTMITGPANFPVAKAQKANRSEENHYTVFQEWRARAKKAIVRKAQPAKTYTSELERYKADLVAMKRNHDLMKQGNARIKKAIKSGEDLTQYLTETFNIAPHMIAWTMKFGFGLQNSNANIKRVEQRIKELEAKESRREENPITKYTFDGGEMLINYEIDRIQIQFTNRPNSTELVEWKSKGLNTFNWSPSQNAWQRKITNNAMWCVKRMLTGIKKVES